MENNNLDIDILKTIITSNNVFIYLFNIETRVIIWTSGDLATIYGYNPFQDESDLYEFKRDDYHIEDQLVFDSRLTYFSNNQHNCWAGIFRIRHLNGNWVWTYSKLTTILRSSDGKPIQVSGIYMNAIDGIQTPEQMKGLLQDFINNESNDNFKLLTSRELEILRLIALGHSYTDIAEKLYIQPDTVNRHRKNLMKKLKLNSIAKLVCLAVRNGLV